MIGDDFRRRANAVRAIPLENVLTQWGAQRDPRDRCRWHTDRGPLSITGCQFFHWHLDQGGGGAIDLVMQLGQVDWRAAVEWLEHHLGEHPGAGLAAAAPAACSPASSFRTGTHTNSSGTLRLPATDPAKLERVRRYLTEQRCLAANLLQPLIHAGKVYADSRGNAVFLMVTGKANRAIGAELRGTGQQVWRGLAPGTRKDAGYFWVGESGSKKIVLCESAIDAISCFQLLSDCICISTAGVRSDPPWLKPLLLHGYEIWCGFDDDDAGNTASRQMIARHSSIQRLRPPVPDWNDALVARH